MKIRSDFVTNSSTTSFVIISKGEFTKKIFFDLIGLQRNSPLKPMFEELFLIIQENMRPVDNPNAYNKNVELKRLIKNSLKEGKRVYSGHLSSDGDFLESYFCRDSFEIENENLYINGINCTW